MTISDLDYLRQDNDMLFVGNLYFKVLYHVGHGYVGPFLMSMSPLDYRKYILSATSIR